mgnify:CR=1 FL=1
MDVIVSRVGGVVVIDARGRLDSNTAKGFEEKLMGEIATEVPRSNRLSVESPATIPFSGLPPAMVSGKFPSIVAGA